MNILLTRDSLSLDPHTNNIIQSVELNITTFSIALITKKSQCFLRRFAEGLGGMLTAFGKVVKL
jgi:ATP adenylyltransferase/5',5'''-P-1,P-4-tetraphosphate phosphorylase II